MSDENYILAKLQAILAGSSELDAYGCIRVAPILIRQCKDRIEELEAEVQLMGENWNEPNYLAHIAALRAERDLLRSENAALMQIAEAARIFLNTLALHGAARPNKLQVTLEEYESLKRDKGTQTDG